MFSLPPLLTLSDGRPIAFIIRDAFELVIDDFIYSQRLNISMSCGFLLVYCESAALRRN